MTAFLEDIYYKILDQGHTILSIDVSDSTYNSSPNVFEVNAFLPSYLYKYVNHRSRQNFACGTKGMERIKAIIDRTLVNACRGTLLIPLTLRAAKTGLTILDFFFYKSVFRKIFEGEMSTRSQTTTLLQIFCELSLHSQVIFQKYESSRRYFLEEL